MGWAIYIASGLLSLGLIVHCIKTGRNTIWVYVLVVLMSFPFIGSLVYLGAEVLPDALRSRTSQRAMRGIRSTLDPEANLRLQWLATESWRATLRIDNVFDTAYADRADFAFGNYRYFPGRGRAAFLAIDFRH